MYFAGRPAERAARNLGRAFYRASYDFELAAI